ncbi:MAG TPA: hypothetical protein VN461_07440 [Vicinamibacteria bacterium]|nr:hypothetical protein [Vicinamibacteria bacterium]
MRAPTRLLSALTTPRALAVCLLLSASLAGGPSAGQNRTDPVTASLTLFAGTPAGLWRSRDWGGSWQRVLGQTTGAQLDLLGAARGIMPLGPLVYVGGEEGIYLSKDFGEIWERTGSSPPVLCLLSSRYPQSDPTLFVGTAAGLLKSGDGGRTFASTSLWGTSVFRLEWPGPALVMATGRGVLISNDAGAHFEGPGEGLPPGDVRAMALSSFFAVDPVLFVGVGQAGVFRSSNGGRTWVSAGLAGHRVGDLIWLGPFLYAAADGGFFRSEDAGTTWTRLGTAGAGSPTQLLFPLAPAAGLEAFLATDQGLFHTLDGGKEWRPAGFQGESVLAVATFPPPSPLRRGKTRK